MAALALSLLIAACGDAGATPVAHTITGTFTLEQTDKYVTKTATGCAGNNGYDDIADGLGVTVKNESGTILGTGSLVSQALPTTILSTKCVLTFSVSGVPDTATFYTVTVGKRGDTTSSHAEMAASGWAVALTLGK